MFGAIARYVRGHHVALLALFVALGGTAVAATVINGKSIKPRSIPENRLTPQALASLKASDPAVYCAAAKAKPASYPIAPCLSRAEAVDEGFALAGIAIGRDGNPVVAHSNHPMRLDRCDDPACAGKDSILSDVNGTYFGGGSSAIAIGSNGNPLIAQFNVGAFDGGDLNIVACNDPSCADDNEAGTYIDGPEAGRSPSVAIGRDGNPIISYYDVANGDLKVAHCNDPACVDNDETITPVDSDPSTDVGEPSSIAIGADGKPVIAYYDATNADLKVIRCNDVACAGANETTSVVDSLGLVGKSASVSIGTDGKPVIAYYDEGDSNLKVAHCNDKACAGGDEKLTLVATSGQVGSYASIAIGLDGRPVIAYYDSSSSDLEFARCNDLACAGGNERLETLDSDGSVGANASLAIGLDGIPVVAYEDATNGTIKVARAPVLP